jgi:hypothetical protein
VWLGAGLAVATVASVIPAWDQWDEIAREIVVRRQAFQGVPVQSGKVEFMQALLPEMLIVVALLSLIPIFLTRKTLRY